MSKNSKGGLLSKVFGGNTSAEGEAQQSEEQQLQEEIRDEENAKVLPKELRVKMNTKQRNLARKKQK